MKNTDIDSFLRSNKPQVKDDPTFLLEVQQKMQAVEGIKSEVDIQRRHVRRALLAALAAGMVCTAAVTLLAYLYPIDPQQISEGFFSSIRVFIDTWKHYLLIPVAGFGIALWALGDGTKSSTSGF